MSNSKQKFVLKFFHSKCYSYMLCYMLEFQKFTTKWENHHKNNECMCKHLFSGNKINLTSNSFNIICFKIITINLLYSPHYIKVWSKIKGLEETLSHKIGPLDLKWYSLWELFWKFTTSSPIHHNSTYLLVSLNMKNKILIILFHI